MNQRDALRLTKRAHRLGWSITLSASFTGAGVGDFTLTLTRAHQVLPSGGFGTLQVTSNQVEDIEYTLDTHPSMRVKLTQAPGARQGVTLVGEEGESDVVKPQDTLAHRLASQG